MKNKVGVVSLGCPKNLVDSEIMLGALARDGFEIVVDKNQADIIIVNTCGFIESAKRESIDTILEMSRCKEENCKLLIVAGCMAERYREEIIKEIPEVDAVVGTSGYCEIVRVIKEAFSGIKPVYIKEKDDIAYLENDRVISTPKGYAYLKIAEGCDNCCSYCIIPALRGRYRSRRMENIIEEAVGLTQKGVREIILVAQDVTRYGLDIYGKRRLVELIRQISRIKDVEWIRLLYSYPDEIDGSLIDEIASNEKVCKYLDIPIQHASDSVLERMGRRGSKAVVEGLIKELRSRIPGIVLRTSVIVGFPGEREEDFQELFEFVKETEFERLGVFMYSREEGTPAAKFSQQVPVRVKKNRYSSIMKLQKEISARKNAERRGRVYKTIIEGIAEDGLFYTGRTYAEAPDVDDTIYLASAEPLEFGKFANVRILNTDDFDLIGEVAYESAQ